MWEEQENSAVQLRLKRHGENTKRTVTARPLPQRHFHRETVYLLHKKFPHPITYTIKGFCAYVGMTEAAFYDLYNKDEKLELVIARMKQDCEIDAREKFENGTIDSRLAGLWMSHYGYTTKTDTEVKSNVGVTIIDDFGDDDE